MLTPAPTELRSAPGRSPAHRVGWRGIGLVAGTYLGFLLVFGILVAARGADPLSVYATMVRTTLLSGHGFEQTLLRAIPIALAALAVAIPARAGLINVGGEGQLIVGAVAATGVGLLLGAALPGPVSWLLLALAGAAAGGAWGALAGALRVTFGANEAVTTLLLNFIANDIMLYLIYQPWKDPNGSGQPQSRPLAETAVLPKLLGSQLNLGLILAALVALGVWLLLNRSGWGFALRVVGGNVEAARRAGLPVNALLLCSMLAGGALAGLGGALNFAGLEGQLRPGITLTFGYIAFLASFLGRHQPGRVIAAALLFSAIALSGNGLAVVDGLDGAIVDVLLGLIVLVPLVLTRHRAAARSAA